MSGAARRARGVESLKKRGNASPQYVVHLDFTLSYVSAGRDLLRTLLGQSAGQGAPNSPNTELLRQEVGGQQHIKAQPVSRSSSAWRGSSPTQTSTRAWLQPQAPQALFGGPGWSSVPRILPAQPQARLLPGMGLLAALGQSGNPVPDVELNPIDDNPCPAAAGR